MGKDNEEVIFGQIVPEQAEKAIVENPMVRRRIIDLNNPEGNQLIRVNSDPDRRLVGQAGTWGR